MDTTRTPHMFVNQPRNRRQARLLRSLVLVLSMAVTATFTPFDLLPRMATAEEDGWADVHVATGRDDVEERPNGTVVDDRRELALTHHRGSQAVGLRFVDVPVPAGAEVTRAWVQFATAAPSSGPASLTIQGQQGPDDRGFVGGRRGVTSRPLTAASASWSPPEWPAADEAGAAQRTTDLAPVLQELVDGDSWDAGKAVVLVVTGNGTRIAASADGPGAAPVLHLEWRVRPSTPPSPMPEPSPSEEVTASAPPSPEPTTTDSPSPDDDPTPSPEPTTTEDPSPDADPGDDPTSAPTPSVKAFPTAEGFGQGAVGGRGGRVIEVTTLADAGPGSLRAALEASGPRIVVFRVSGTITLLDNITIDEPYVTVAGQTAPGEGIQIRNDPSNLDEAIRIETHDVVMRFLRIRPGPTSSPTCCSGAVTILHGARAVMLDHLSLSWGVDENISAGNGAHDYTVQWSIISQALHDSTHKEGPHSMGAHFGSWSRDHPPSAHHSMSLHHNLLAHNNRRNPRITNAGRDVIANNVIYNWGQAAIQGGDDSGETFAAAFIGNVLLAGANTGKLHEIHMKSEHVPTPGFELYVAGNMGPRQPDPQGDQSLLLNPDGRPWMVDAPTFSWPEITITSASTAYEQVLALAGATRPVRDPVDDAVVASVRTRTGTLIDHPGQAGGWPDLAAGPAVPDGDRDGMDDRWELDHGLDPERADGNLVAPNGYTWVENYLNELAGDPV